MLTMIPRTLAPSSIDRIADEMLDAIRRDMVPVDDILGGLWMAPGNTGRRGWMAPPVDITEDEKEFRLMAELPGLAPGDFKVELVENRLVIRGEKKTEKEEKMGEAVVRERRSGSFMRSFGLPPNVETDKIEATFKDGVLTIALPKKPGPQPERKPVEVKPAGN